ncbi:hypothetical protein BJ165DRAFT_430899 [Panaeolus papilionaceus]|nr:hypothetical protein BJ165DRAFT_430899 [Panaeolus papilionaceus]
MMISKFDYSGGCTLPIELLVKIFNDLLDDYSHSRGVQSCLLASKQFNAILLPLILNHGVELGYCPPKAPCANLNRDEIIKNLTRYPHLIQHIHHVSFRAHNGLLESMNYNPWLESSPRLHLTNVRSMSIRMECFWLRHHSISRIAIAYRGLLEHHLHSHVLKTLSIQNVQDIPIFDILASSSLEFLNFEDCTFADVEPKFAPVIPIATGSSLISLRVDSLCVTPFPMFALQHLPKLKTVEFKTLPAYSSNLDPSLSSPPFIPHILNHLAEITTPNLQLWSAFCPRAPDHNGSPSSPFPVLKALSLDVAP